MDEDQTLVDLGDADVYAALRLARATGCPMWARSPEDAPRVLLPHRGGRPGPSQRTSEGDE